MMVVVCVTIPSQHYLSDNCFSFMSTLADAMRSTDMSRSPDSLILYPRFPYHVPLARVLIHSCSFSRVSLLVPVWIVDSSPVTFLSSVSPFVSMTRLLMFLTYAFLLLCLDYSSAVSLFLDSSHTDDSLVYLRLVYLFRMFVLVSRRPLYIRVGDGIAPHLQSTLQPP